jgi:hypothetical protein
MAVLVGKANWWPSRPPKRGVRDKLPARNDESGSDEGEDADHDEAEELASVAPAGPALVDFRDVT